MAMAVQCVSTCLTLNSQFKSLSLRGSSSLSSSFASPGLASSNSISFCATVSHNIFSPGSIYVQKPMRHSIVCEAAPTKTADSAAKRARQAEKRRLYNRAKKSEVRTRMKKVLEELDGLKKKQDAKPDEILTIEKLIAEAYSVIDKAIKAGTLHRNTGARRKSRLARRKKAVEIHHGWYSPTPETAIAA